MVNPSSQGPQGQYPPPGPFPPPYQGQPGPYLPSAGAYPGAPFGVDPYGRPLSDKSKITAGLLGIFLGGFGIGRFYLGYTNIGVLQLVVSFVTCGLGALWGTVDGILILIGNVPDAQGRPLRE
jgi:TM2 domain-containing membrane protein YozV